jgi:uncharacterized protein YndB with AHSA1/START domain
LPVIEASRVIKAPRAKVWAVFTDPENQLKWDPEGIKSVKILERKGNTVSWEGRHIMGGREVTLTHKYTLYPTERIEEVLEGPAVSRGGFKFEEVPEGTKMTLSYDISFKGVIGRIIGRLLVGPKLGEYADQILENLAKYIEAQ